MTPTSDSLIEGMVRSTALAVHDREATLDRIMEQMPIDEPRVEDEDAPTAAERAECRDAAARLDAWNDQRVAAREQLSNANRAHRDALRLAGRLALDEDAAEVMSGWVLHRGAASVAVPATSVSPAMNAPRGCAPTPRPRSSQRRRAQARSSSRGGDSGDDGDGSDDGPGDPDGLPEKDDGRRALVLLRRGEAYKGNVRIDAAGWVHLTKGWLRIGWGLQATYRPVVDQSWPRTLVRAVRWEDGETR